HHLPLHHLVRHNPHNLHPRLPPLRRPPRRLHIHKRHLPNHHRLHRLLLPCCPLHSRRIARNPPPHESRPPRATQQCQSRKS
ncbi:MAG: hypothetical protein Q9169_008743, partial [Polycauliona sp. 2 TL-2023]